jgi:predicted phosphodiesterase
MDPTDGLIFIGDVHRRWDLVVRGLASLRPARHIVLLGTWSVAGPLDCLTDPLRADGATLHWIHGNHDADGGREMSA